MGLPRGVGRVSTISETPTPLKQNRPLKIRLQRVSRMVGYPTLRIFLSFAINPIIAFGTPRDKQTNFVPTRCAATEGNRQHSPARSFKPSVLYFPSRQSTPTTADCYRITVANSLDKEVSLASTVPTGDHPKATMPTSSRFHRDRPF